MFNLCPFRTCIAHRHRSAGRREIKSLTHISTPDPTLSEESAFYYRSMFTVCIIQNKSITPRRGGLNFSGCTAVLFKSAFAVAAATVCTRSVAICCVPPVSCPLAAGRNDYAAENGTHTHTLETHFTSQFSTTPLHPAAVCLS